MHGRFGNDNGHRDEAAFGEEFREVELAILIVEEALEELRLPFRGSISRGAGGRGLLRNGIGLLLRRCLLLGLLLGLRGRRKARDQQGGSRHQRARPHRAAHYPGHAGFSFRERPVTGDGNEAPIARRSEAGSS
jgi:hypothetical protein